MDYVLIFVVGLAVGAGGTFGIFHLSRRGSQEQLRQAFSSLAGEALDANSRRLADAAASQLDGKKALIDQTLQSLSERLEGVRQYLQGIEAQRRQDFGQLAGSVQSLSQSAGQLHQMLASTQRRGAWGERMAEDVLRLAGLQEKVNYLKQSTADAASGRAEFTFLLTNDLKANMDVKFPLERYKAYLDAPDDAQRAACVHELCTAVRGHLRDVARRGYIDPAVPTVPYVIVFIPSEQIFGLVLAAEPDLMDEAMGAHIVLASPLTLYAHLAIMRQAADHANLTRTADEVIALLEQFHKQWQLYNEQLDKLGQRIDGVAEQFRVVTTTRSNMLQKPLDKIEDLRQARGLPEA